ncbi:calcineurin-like phosphoesterase family protein [Rhizobium sp. PP-WC-1G-195]|nr:calcineurin-like phosphoesterase family protein [Rhizobium sp. PP-WC-1G-195]
MAEAKTFTLLHLSDLHAGMTLQNTLWPNVNEVFFRDLTSVHKQIGKFDAVLFSGDFAQRGADVEFDEVIDRLKNIWTHLNSLGSNPWIICVPGNHDLQRPNPKSPEVRMLTKWVEEPDVLDDFFKGKDDPYFKIVSEAFLGYSRFVERLKLTSIPVAESRVGVLPGDQVARIRAGDVTVGILGLNSTWLQITGENHFGRLCVDHRQVFGLEPDLGKWCDANHFNVVVTHQPLDWLAQKNLDVWRREIDPPGRFDIHLFGHMHEPFSESRAESGAVARHSMQAPSLFGMENLGDGVTARIHGYSVLQFGVTDEGARIRIYPRKLKVHKSGQQRFVANDDFILEEDQYFTILLKPRPLHLTPPIDEVSTGTFEAADAENKTRDILRPLSYHLRLTRSHQRVRQADQQQCQTALESNRWVWLTAEWGLGGDEFLASVLQRSSTERRIYRLDASDYTDRDNFGADTARKLGCSFAQFCDSLSSQPTALILDDVPTGLPSAPGAIPLENDVEAFVEVLLDACPALVVIMRTLRKPLDVTAPSLQLARLDEADTKLYVGEHEHGGTELTGSDAIAILYRHTDGYPTRLEVCLKELTVISLQDLSTVEDGAADEKQDDEDIPSVLRKTISGLSTAEDKPTRRMYSMLLALIVFPQGTELNRIKRFNGVNGFYPSDALSLSDRALITVSEVPEVSRPKTTSPPKIMIVPRPIRDYLRAQVDEKTLESLTMKAAALLFGDNWMSGSKSWPSNLDYSSAECIASDIANAGSLLLRLFRQHRDDPKSREAVSVTALAASFADALCNGSHYTSAANFCRDFLTLMNEEDFPDKRAHLVRHYGSALRMLGETERASELLLEALDFPFPKGTKQDILIEVALCHETLGQIPEAVSRAKEVMQINRKSALAAQAQSIIFEHELQEPERTLKLVELERSARRKNNHTVADNISLTLAGEADNDVEAKALLANVLKSSGDKKEFYNKARAILEIVERKIDANLEISDIETTQIVACYQFVLNERVPWMFKKCHRILWRIFENAGNWDNLLTLFRYSSMIWRLRGEDATEKLYLHKLNKRIEKLPSGVVQEKKISHYYYARLSHYNASLTTIEGPE